MKIKQIIKLIEDAEVIIREPSKKEVCPVTMEELSDPDCGDDCNYYYHDSCTAICKNRKECKACVLKETCEGSTLQDSSSKIWEGRGYDMPVGYIDFTIKEINAATVHHGTQKRGYDTSALVIYINEKT